MTLRTFDELHDECNASGQPCSYHGEHGDWLIVLHQHRDSDLVDISNFQVAYDWLYAVNPDAVTIEREGHWAVGWIETLLIDPAALDVVREAKRIKADLESYPILDEGDYCTRENDECENVWLEVFTPADRIEHFRQNSYHAPDWPTLYHAIRGSWYHASMCLNCPSDLIHA